MTDNVLSANDPMVTHALGHMMYDYTLLVPTNTYIHIYSYIHIYTYIDSR